MTHDQLPFTWARSDDGRWHRVTGVTSSSDGASSINTLCDRVLDEADATRGEPPIEGGERCRDCEIEGEAAPPNH